MAFILRSIGLGKSSKHQKLPEEWIDCQEAVISGITFYCKYLGNTPMELNPTTNDSNQAVRNIIKMTKAKGNKLPSVALLISPVYISATIMKQSSPSSSSSPFSSSHGNGGDGGGGGGGKQYHTIPPNSYTSHEATVERMLAAAGDAVHFSAHSHSILKEWKLHELAEKMLPSLPSLNSKLAKKFIAGGGKHHRGTIKGDGYGDQGELFKIGIYAIPYCFADDVHERVVSFVATNPNGSQECHAFMTQKSKHAKAIAVTISHAFRIAFERCTQEEEAAAAKQQKKQDTTEDNSVLSVTLKNINANKQVNQQPQQLPRQKSSSSSSSSFSSSSSSIGLNPIPPPPSSIQYRTKSINNGKENCYQRPSNKSLVPLINLEVDDNYGQSSASSFSPLSPFDITFTNGDFNGNKATTATASNNHKWSNNNTKASFDLVDLF